LITFLATLVPGLNEQLRLAVVQGAVVGGGLTVIANAPNPAGQALLARFFDGAVMPMRLLVSAIPPTLIAALAFRLL
jgi:Na+/H+ antiporter NhaD/arsenite permease-like protein